MDGFTASRPNRTSLNAAPRPCLHRGWLQPSPGAACSAAALPIAARSAAALPDDARSATALLGTACSTAALPAPPNSTGSSRSAAAASPAAWEAIGAAGGRHRVASQAPP
ncbi:hypothetical protein E2562_022623 [Oryza meyeriana var. granulata]|uniref:Uncharacterized protein n=1 Tax=Oryza meyeriana var. granulata TaxID=110450 RepID=A0A6G1CTS4_9ORYZ|nr:hypothetical protein E2562_022623 [Oryza meyeriana var. granulata]